MKQASIGARLVQGGRDYVLAVRAFSHNARMYLLAATFLSVAMAVHAVLYNLYLLTLKYDEIMVGQVSAATALGVALGGPPAGLLYDAWGGKRTFTLATAAIALTMALRSLAVTPFWLLAWAFLNGLASALFFVSIFPFITGQSSPRERSHLYSMNTVVWAGFGMVGSLLGGYLPGFFAFGQASSGALAPQRASLLVAAGLGLLAVWPLASVRLVAQTPSQKGATGQERGNGRDWPAIGKGGLVMFGLGLITGLTSPFYNVYFARIFQAGSELVGNLFTLSQFMMLLASLMLPFLVHRWGLVQGPILVAMAAAPLTLAMGLPLPLVVVPAFLLSVGLARLMDTPLQNLLMEAVHPSDRGTMSGVRLITNYGAQALAGWLGGQLIVGYGYFSLFAAAAAITLAVALLVWTLFHSRESTLETVAASRKAEG
ncbi:MAG: MFS transporter [Anaerolineae bacterium]|nr:MFS transporter [Anaerolineae bacterium]